MRQRGTHIGAHRQPFRNITLCSLATVLRGRGLGVRGQCDDRQKTREGEAKALRDAGLTALWLGPFWSKKTFWDQAKWIITRWSPSRGGLHWQAGSPVEP